MGFLSWIAFFLALLVSGAWGQSFPVHAVDPVGGEFPGGRGADQMIVYTSALGRATTGTNEWGAEAVVEGGVVISVGTNDSRIPADGFVVSGHGVARNWVNQTLAPGTAVAFDEREVRVDTSAAGQVNALRWRARDGERRLRTLGVEVDCAALREAIEEMAISLDQDNIEERLAQVTREVEEMEADAWSTELARMDSPAGEIRAAWHRLTETTREEIAALADQLAQAHINVFFPETIYGSQAIFDDATGLFPLHGHFDGLDALAVLIEECHARGIEVHAWIHCFLIGVRGNADEPPLLAARHPEWLAQDREGRQESLDEPGYVFINPAHPEARRALIDAYAALVESHDLDGLQLDYIRYPHHQRWERDWDHSDHTRARVQDALGFDPREITPEANSAEWHQWLAWREEVITSFVVEAVEAVRAVDPNIRLTSAVFPDLPTAIETKGQNWAAWQARGLMDAIIPMAYTTDPTDVTAAAEELHRTVGTAGPTVLGLGPYLGLSPRQLVEQIAAARAAGATGQCLFCWGRLTPAAQRALAEGPWRGGGPAAWP